NGLLTSFLKDIATELSVTRKHQKPPFHSDAPILLLKLGYVANVRFHLRQYKTQKSQTKLVENDWVGNGSCPGSSPG
ncbi:MAG: hypothetical protein ABFQ95_04115, partial [Pseudomonadota bacterium]